MKNRQLKHSILLLAFLLAAWAVVNYGFYSFRQAFVDGDGSGYFAYLPSILIYHTVDFREYAEKSPVKDERFHQPHYFFETQGELVNKYTCGTALLQSPLFLASMGAVWLTGREPDGFSQLFQLSVSFSALICLFLGLIFLKKLLGTYAVPDKTILFILIAGLLGTNLFFYTFIQPSMSHGYSFFAITTFAYLIRKAVLTHSSRKLYLAVLMFGLVVLIRPVNGIALLVVPFLAGSLPALASFLRGMTVKRTAISMTVFILTVSPQIIINILQTGKAFLWLYPGEGFNFSHPRLFSFLFSFKKGWFIYTPFMLFILPALYSVWKRSHYEFISYLCFLLFTIYLFSSWWNWFYGDGFGMRPMVDFYGLWLIAIGLFFHSVHRKWKAPVMFAVLLMLILNTVQTYQYTKGILHADSMNREAYWYVFLKTSKEYRDVIGASDEPFYGKLSEEPVVTAVHDFERDYRGWIKLKEPDTGPAHSGRRFFAMDSLTSYSVGYSQPVNHQMTGRNDLYARLSVYYYEPFPNSASGAVFAADILDSTYQSLYYRTFRVKPLPDRVGGQWREGTIGFRLPKLYPEAAEIRYYIWNKGHGNFFLDDLKVDLFEIK